MQEKEVENTMQNTERDYLNRRLVNMCGWTRDQKIRAIFNIDVRNEPKTYKELIAAIKNDKFKLNDKRVKLIDAGIEENSGEYYHCGPFDGIIWDGPQPDFKGWEAAQEESNRRHTAAKDVINTGTPAEGLKALQDFEAWMPTPTTTA